MKKLLLFILMIPSLCLADNWSCINRAALVCNTWIMWVPTGWIVASDNTNGGEHGYAMVFVPDQKHEWK